jgi:hypothetical protein
MRALPGPSRLSPIPISFSRSRRSTAAPACRSGRRPSSGAFPFSESIGPGGKARAPTENSAPPSDLSVRPAPRPFDPSSIGAVAPFRRIAVASPANLAGSRLRIRECRNAALSRTTRGSRIPAGRSLCWIKGGGSPAPRRDGAAARLSMPSPGGIGGRAGSGGRRSGSQRDARSAAEIDLPSRRLTWSHAVSH